MREAREIDESHDAAIKIQAFARGIFSRKKYSIKQIPKPDLENYKVLIQGNDPLIHFLTCHEADEKIALIGTSGIRSVELALQLSRGEPKVIIIDNSIQVVEFWREARKLISDADSTKQFLVNLICYIAEKKCNRDEITPQEIHYLEYLFYTHGFERVKKIISSATILAQSWADKHIMAKVKNILAVTGIENIYAYPSNIVAYLYDKGEKENAREVLNNIQTLNPILAIHTGIVGKTPKNVYLVDEHSPEKVEKKLQLSDTIPQLVGLSFPIVISPDLRDMILRYGELNAEQTEESSKEDNPFSPSL